MNFKSKLSTENLVSKDSKKNTKPHKRANVNNPERQKLDPNNFFIKLDN